MKKVRIAILGYGVIGKGVFKICLEKEEIEVIKIFDYKKNLISNMLVFLRIT